MKNGNHGTHRFHSAGVFLKALTTDHKRSNLTD